MTSIEDVEPFAEGYFSVLQAEYPISDDVAVKMKLLPFQSWELASPLNVRQLVGGMSQRIELTNLFRWPFSSGHTPLQGKINECGFEVSRTIHYRNSFLPILKGRFVPTATGTTIRITMTLHDLVLAFLAVWFGMLALFALAGILALVEKGDWTFLLVIGGMAFFSGALTCGCFWAEAGIAKNLFSRVLLEVHNEAANKSVQSVGIMAEPPPLPRA